MYVPNDCQNTSYAVIPFNNWENAIEKQLPMTAGRQILF